MKRLFTLGFGLGAGATGAILVRRWVERKSRAVADAVSPSAIAGQVAEGARDLASLVRVSMEEGRRAKEQREAELRATLPDGAVERTT